MSDKDGGIVANKGSDQVVDAPIKGYIYGALRTENLLAACRQDGRGGEALSGDRLPGAPEGQAGQEARRVFPERYRYVSGSSMMMPPVAHMGLYVRKQGFCRRFHLEVPALADDPGGKRTPGSVVGTASLTGQDATIAAASNF